MQQQIDYNEVNKLGFEETRDIVDPVFRRIHGFDFFIVNKWLTKKIYIDWDCATRLCTLVRVDSHKDQNIMNKMPIKDLAELKRIVSFYCDNICDGPFPKGCTWEAPSDVFKNA